MKKFRRIISIIVVIAIMACSTITTQALFLFKRPERTYEVSNGLNKNLKKIYNNYNFEIGWGIYDISRGTLKEVASYNVDKSFQSNCTIKAAMLLYICKLMDSGELSKQTKLSVKKGNLHYDDFSSKSGKYSVEYLLTQMINVSNNACYEVLLRYVTRENFNTFLKRLGSGTQIKSYNYMGNCLPKDRATEWLSIYKYCHSDAKNSQFAWDLLVEAKYSPIRDGLQKTVAHKSGWHYKKGAYGTAADCAIVKTEQGGCYLVVIFTKNNSKKNYSKKLIQKLAITLDDIWEEYYNNLIYPKVAKF